MLPKLLASTCGVVFVAVACALQPGDAKPSPKLGPHEGIHLNDGPTTLREPELDLRKDPELSKQLKESLPYLKNLDKIRQMSSSLESLEKRFDRLDALERRLTEATTGSDKLIAGFTEFQQDRASRQAVLESKIDLLLGQTGAKREPDWAKLRGSDTKVLHIPQGPDLPQTQVFPIALFDATRVKKPTWAGSLGLASAPEVVPSTVVFVALDTATSAKVIGNGVLVSPRRVLTAKHVAEEVSRFAAADNLALYWFQADGTPVGQKEPLEYQEIRVKSWMSDPDLAFVVLKAPAKQHPAPLTPAREPLTVNKQVFFVGAWALTMSPNVGNGIVTSTPKLRQLAEQTKLTVQGTSLCSFDGQSGSPVFDSATGELYGIFVGGWKWFAPSGETVYTVPARAEWEESLKWSWVVPIHLYRDWIDDEIKGDVQ